MVRTFELQMEVWLAGQWVLLQYLSHFS